MKHATDALNQSQRPGRILLVDSSEDDIHLLARALEDAGIKYYLDVERSGAEAIGYLKARISAKDGDGLEWPTLVLLRAWLRDMDGVEVLSWVRSEPAAQKLKVYVIGTTPLELGIAQEHEAVANGYWLKPSTAGEYSELAQRVKGRMRRR